LLAIAAIALLVGLPSAAAAQAGAHRPVSVPPRYTKVPGNTLLSDGRYAFLETGNGNGTHGVLIDDRTGTRRTLAFPDSFPADFCPARLIGGGWMLLGCNNGNGSATWQLYSIATDRTSVFSVAPAISACGPGCVGSVPTAIGAHWVELLDQPPDPMHGPPPMIVFENIQTGAVRADPSTATTTFDLDAPQLTEPVCAPLSQPSLRVGGPKRYGELSALGDRFELTGRYLERCGTHIHLLLPAGHGGSGGGPTIAANSRVVVSSTAAGGVSGLFLPSLRPFTIPPPPHTGDQFRQVGGAYTLGLTDTAIYISSGRHNWRIAVPSDHRRTSTP
jgi:hypothetical protein